jgi:hypothetical protein
MIDRYVERERDFKNAEITFLGGIDNALSY